MVDKETLTKKLMGNLSLSKLAKLVFGEQPKGRVHNLFKEAAQAQKSHEANQRAVRRQRADEILQRHIDAFITKVQTKAPAVRGEADEKLQNVIASGKGPNAVWDFVTARHMTASFYFPGLDAVNGQDLGGIGHGRASGKSMVAYLKENHPVFWSRLHDLFNDCLQQDMAVAFGFPEKVEGTPRGYSRVMGKNIPEGEEFWRMDITVSPLDLHYTPATVASFSGEFGGGYKRYRGRDSDSAYFFNDVMRSALHPDNVLKRLVTGRRYTM